jgi:hypothetical protein
MQGKRKEGCDRQVKAMSLGASNLWFPAMLTTLAILTEPARLEQLVERHYLHRSAG